MIPASFGNWCAEMSRKQRDAVAASGVRVLGDVDDLLAAEPMRTGPTTVTAEQLNQTALQSLVEFAEARLREQEGQRVAMSELQDHLARLQSEVQSSRMALESTTRELETLKTRKAVRLANGVGRIVRRVKSR